MMRKNLPNVAFLDILKIFGYFLDFLKKLNDLY